MSSRRSKSGKSALQSPDSIRSTRSRPGSVPMEITVSDDLTVATSTSVASDDSVGLPVPIKKQLLNDIEHPSFGGIKRLQKKLAKRCRNPPPASAT